MSASGARRAGLRVRLRDRRRTGGRCCSAGWTRSAGRCGNEAAIAAFERGASERRAGMKRFTSRCCRATASAPRSPPRRCGCCARPPSCSATGSTHAEYAVGAAGRRGGGDSLPRADAGRGGRRPTRCCSARSATLRWPAAEGRRRPEAGLLALRKLLGAYANLRPVAVHPALAHASPLRPERLDGRGPPDRAGADRRALLRRAAGAGAGQRGEHPALHGGGDRAGGAGGVRGGRGRAARPGDVGGQGERAGGLAALARDGHAGRRGGVSRTSGSSTCTWTSRRCAWSPIPPRSTCC